MIRIDQTRCNNCLICVKDCIAGVWEESDGKPRPRRPYLCSRCGHCVAVCKPGAIEHTGLGTAPVQRVFPDLLDAEVFREIAQSRRSVRLYKKRKVPQKMIERILDVARYAPTASNSQHVEYIVITSSKRLQDISERVFSWGMSFSRMLKIPGGRFLFAGLGAVPGIARLYERYIEPMDIYARRAKEGRDLILHGAPVLILLHAPSFSFFGSANCSIAATHIVHYAHALGLGTCFIGFVTLASRFDKTLRGLLGVPGGRSIHASLVMGYPAIKYRFIPPRKDARIRWISDE